MMRNNTLVCAALVATFWLGRESRPEAALAQAKPEKCGTCAEADHAKKADVATRADSATTATSATKAAVATRAEMVSSQSQPGTRPEVEPAGCKTEGDGGRLIVETIFASGTDYEKEQVTLWVCAQSGPAKNGDVVTARWRKLRVPLIK